MKPLVNCSVAGCKRLQLAHGLCAMHYTRQKRWGSPEISHRKVNILPFTKCTAQNCNREARTKGLCPTHYRRFKLYNDANFSLAGHDHNRRMQDGYVVIKLASGKWIKEHRYVMEQALGRPLTPSEIVHHKDGDTTNNKLENLELMTRGQHTSLHQPVPTTCFMPNCSSSYFASGYCLPHYHQWRKHVHRHWNSKL